MKFSIIVPILNVENYLKKCLDSIVNQTYKNYECILICDDSDDNSNKIAEEYTKKNNFQKYYHKNTGLSEARNIGVNVSKGDYIIFLDSDDYLELDLLEVLNKTIKNQDLVRYQIREIFNDKCIDWNEQKFEGSGTACFSKIINFHYVENAWAYCYKSSFYKKNKFRFMKDCIAEDFGLLPLIIAKASKVSIISYIGYNYVQRENSLMNNPDYNKKIKKMNDLIKQSKYLISELKNMEKNEIFIGFINISLIYFSTTLKYKDYLNYNKILKGLGRYDCLIHNNFKQRIRNILIKYNAYIFYNYILRLYD